MRYLALFLGHSSYAVVAVLVAFMGGLALGNAWLGGKADSAKEPLAFYGWLEVGIGVFGLFFPKYYELCHTAFISAAQYFDPGSLPTQILKFIFALLTIMLPTFLMGGTLPILTRFVTKSLGELREKVAALYCFNSAGAVAGCIAADFWWIPSYGLQATVLAGAAINLGIGGVALWLNQKYIRGSQLLEVRTETFANHAEEEKFSASELKLAVIGIGVSGFVAMLYEVAWTRMLALALGSSTHAFSLMLITFISGIAVGGWIIYRWRGLRRTLEAFAWAELALAATLFISLFFYEYLPFIFAKLAGYLTRKEDTYPLYGLLQAGICFLVMFVPTVCLGMTLPLASRIATAELAQTGRSVGRVFAVNTVGTVLGASLTGLWLMPSLGLARTFLLGITGNFVIGVTILARHNRRTLTGTLGIAAGVVVIFSWLTGLIPKIPPPGFWPQSAQLHRWPQAFTLGLWREDRPIDLERYRARIRGNSLTYYRDGAGATVSVNIWPDSSGNTFAALRVNGKTDASVHVDVSTQLLLGHIPMLLRPQSTDVLVIGLGSGMTTGAVSRHPVQRLDTVEILPEVSEATRQSFDQYNWDVLNDPRSRLYIEDAKTYLQIARRQYDIIVSEPSNPWMGGVAGVFSREFYLTCRDRLKTGGLMTQWVQLYESDDRVFDLVLGTFSNVFPYVTIWQTQTLDLLLIGSSQPITINMETTAARINDPKVQADLHRIQLSTLGQFLSCEVTSQHNTRFLATTKSLHSDYRPILEYLAQKSFFIANNAVLWRKFDERASTAPQTFLGEHLRQQRLHPSDYQNIIEFQLYSVGNNSELLRSILRRWQQESPEEPAILEFASKLRINPAIDAELQAIHYSSLRLSLPEITSKQINLLIRHRENLLKIHRTYRSAFYLPPAEELRAVLYRLLELDPDHQRVYKLELAELDWDAGDTKNATALTFAALDPNASAKNDFSLSPGIVEAAVARLIENTARTNDLKLVARLLNDAKRFDYPSPELDLVRRKYGELMDSNNTVPRGPTSKSSWN